MSFCYDVLVIVFLFHSLSQFDSTCGADEATEVTPHTLGAYDVRLTGGSVEDDGLMSTIVAGGLAASATHTHLAINLGIDDGLTVEFVGIHEYSDRLANQVREMTHTAFGHITLQTLYQVVDDAIAILHDSGTYLNIE